MKRERAALMVSILIFLGIGVWLLIWPEALEGIGIKMLSADARIDVRATYGGIELGFVSFLSLCLLRDEWVSVGLVASGCVIAGLGIVRLIAIAIEGQGSVLMWSLAAGEVFGALALFMVYRWSKTKG